MFGLRNSRGSCWVNTCLQAVFRIPEVQERYASKIFEKNNVIDECLCRIWNTKGGDGLKDFFESVKTSTMPAGDDIGDAHELFNYLCDKLPFLDEIVRFKMADSITCVNCQKKEIREDSVIEFPIDSPSEKKRLDECILQSVTPQIIDSWKCEHCLKTGCKKQQLIGSFPKAFVFHRVFPNEVSIEYPCVLVLNKKKYALLSVSCFNGGHWWSYGRNMPPGTDWYRLDDQHVINHGPKEFPISPSMRFAIYYRIEN